MNTIYQELTAKQFQSYKKSSAAMQLIRAAIMDNDFMKKLEEAQIKVNFNSILWMVEPNELQLQNIPHCITCTRFVK